MQPMPPRPSQVVDALHEIAATTELADEQRL